MSRDFLSPYFLGPYAENDEVLEKTVVEFLRDHVYWRRNFHPTDPPPISTAAAQSPEHQEFVARMRRELHLLSAALKRSVPFSSPRYIGHMASDLLLPGLIAHITALPYNPNNVVDDAAPVTLDLELDVGLQLARMFGFAADESRHPCALGHLTSGGTVANYEALWLLRSVRYFPLAARAAAVRCAYPLSLNGQALEAYSDWELFNLPLDAVLKLHQQIISAAGSDAPAPQDTDFALALTQERIEQLGLVEFHARRPTLQSPLLLVPATAHYSWEKAMKLLGLGSAQLREIGQRGMRMDADALKLALAEAAAEQRPVLAVVGVLGSTEYGTLDPVHRIVAARRHWQTRGLNFGIHVDAAWGGYLASLFRAEDGSLLSRPKVRRGFQHFPSGEVYQCFKALAEVDSITVDPHKLGYVPYGAGAFVCRDSRYFDFVAQDACYVFNDAASVDFRSKFRALGRYVLEGSKSGAMAAAVYVNHRCLPLNRAHFGRLQAETIKAAEYFSQRVQQLSVALSDVVSLTVPFTPDTNLICLAFNRKGNNELAEMNRFTQAVYEHLKIAREQPLQNKEFFGSSTLLELDNLGSDDAERILAALGLNPIASTSTRPDSMLILRHTLMNPWLIDENNGVNYIDLYCDYLEQLIRKQARNWSKIELIN